MSDSEPQSEPVVGQARLQSEGRLYIRKYLFGFFGLRRGIDHRNSQEQAERVILVTPLADGDDVRQITAFFKPSAALGLKAPISSLPGMTDAVT